MALVDRSGRMFRFTLTPGNAAEAHSVEELLDGLATGELIADRAYDTARVRGLLSLHGITATIPSTRSRRQPIPYDEESCKARHLVENLFADLKQFRGIATRYCKLAATFRAFPCLAGWLLATRRCYALRMDLRDERGDRGTQESHVQSSSEQGREDSSEQDGLPRREVGGGFGTRPAAREAPKIGESYRSLPILCFPTLRYSSFNLKPPLPHSRLLQS